MVHFTVLLILAASMVLFIWGRWRYDIVALLALAAGIITKAVPIDQIYSGLSNPAVVTVACVMIISYAITRSGSLNLLIKHTGSLNRHITTQVGGLCVITAVLSAFMNNVGALGIMMPIAVQSLKKTHRSPSIVLMPIALASALGGLTTLIGTPANLLISSYRQQYLNAPYQMFDFSKIGIPIAIIGVLVTASVLWRLIPAANREPKDSEARFEVHDYIFEIRIREKSKANHLTVAEFENQATADVTVLGMIRQNKKSFVIAPQQRLQANDILIIEATTSQLQSLIDQFEVGLQVHKRFKKDTLVSEDTSIIEAVVPPNTNVVGQSAKDLKLRSRERINLVALSRSGKVIKQRINQVALRSGDMVLLQGRSDTLSEKITQIGLLPLIERGIHKVGIQRFMPIIIFLASILLTILKLAPIEAAFGAAVIALIVLKHIPLTKVYDAVDWPIIILLAAMLPLGTAIQSSGGSEWIAQAILSVTNHANPVIILLLILLVTMMLSDVINNVTTTVVMAPIAVSVAISLHLNIDTFLMTTAVGASCSFLTPIGHQNSTLVMGPGGYQFSDYFRLGMPLELIIILITMPLVLWAWPLHAIT